MKKIELVKEQGLDDIVTYSIEVDGYYVPGTCSRDIKEVEKKYNTVLGNNGEIKTKEILKSTEI